MASYFRLTDAAKDFFSVLRSKNEFTYEFDSFYFCAMIGMAAKRKGQVTNSNSTDIVDNYPERYRDKMMLLVGIFLSSELSYVGLQYNDKRSVHSAIRELVNPDEPSKLSGIGMTEFNKFSAGGIEVLLEQMPDKPRTLEEFIVIYHKLINSQS